MTGLVRPDDVDRGSGCLPAARGCWEVTDAESGELLATGEGIDAFDAVCEATPTWYHSDRISERAFEDIDCPTNDFGLPSQLARAVRELA